MSIHYSGSNRTFQICFISKSTRLTYRKHRRRKKLSHHHIPNIILYQIISSKRIRIRSSIHRCCYHPLQKLRWHPYYNKFWQWPLCLFKFIDCIVFKFCHLVQYFQHFSTFDSRLHFRNVEYFVFIYQTHRGFNTCCLLPVKCQRGTRNEKHWFSAMTLLCYWFSENQ